MKMTVRAIIGPDNPILRQKARAVSDPNAPAVQQLIDDLIETMRAAPGVGLAAPQVAVSQRIAVIEFAPGSDDLPRSSPLESERPALPGRPGKLRGLPPEAEPPPPKLYVIVNPEITARSDEMVEGVEACLSLPGYAGDVLRHEAVTVKALNRRGKPVKIKARGWLARIFQHEIDHLNGVLFIDRASRAWRVQEGSPDEAELMKE
jgi:peptide deformylase